MLLKDFLLALPLASQSFATITYKGHDLSSLKLMEDAQGAHFYDTSGNEKSCEDILKAGGMNTVRLRLWTRTDYGLDYTLNLAKRFYNKGLKIYLDFHFSDTWADPSHNNAPSGWPTDLSGLSSKVRSYVSSTLQSFKNAGVPLEIVSLGNEIRTGMLWPTGKIDTKSNDFNNFATLWAAARAGVNDAVSAGVQKPKVMIHIDNGWDSSMQDWWYGKLVGTSKVKTSDWDVFGFSFYPFYGTSATVDNLKKTFSTLGSKYNKPMIVAETDWPAKCSGTTLSNTAIPISAAGQTQWVKEIINALNSNSLGQGIFYWEPAFLNNTSLGSPCDDGGILFDVDWSGWPTTKAKSRSSVNMFL